MRQRDAILYGAALKGLRLLLELSREQVARDAQITVSRLSSVERGQNIHAFAEVLAGLCRALDTERRHVAGVVDALHVEIRQLAGVDLLEASQRHWRALLEPSDVACRRYTLINVGTEETPRFQCSNRSPLPAGEWSALFILRTSDPQGRDTLWITRDAAEVLGEAGVVGPDHHIWSVSACAEPTDDVPCIIAEFRR